MERIKNWLVVLNFVAVGAVITLGVGYGLWILPGMPRMLPMWYSRPWGENQLAHPWVVYWVLAMAGGIGVGGWWLEEKASDKVLGLVLLATAIVVEVITVMAIIRVILMFV